MWSLCVRLPEGKYPVSVAETGVWDYLRVLSYRVVASRKQVRTARRKHRRAEVDPFVKTHSCRVLSPVPPFLADTYVVFEVAQERRFCFCLNRKVWILGRDGNASFSDFQPMHFSSPFYALSFYIII